MDWSRVRIEVLEFADAIGRGGGGATLLLVFQEADSLSDLS